MAIESEQTGGTSEIGSGARSTGGTGGGAYLDSVHMTREQAVYPLTESDIETLALFDSVTGACFSAGFGLISLGVGVLISAKIQGALTDQAWGFVDFAGPYPIGFGVLFVGFGVFAFAKRHSKAERIKRSSRRSQPI